VSTEIQKVTTWEPYQGESYADLTETAAKLSGGDLVKGDLLIGVPFVITFMTFREGDYLNAGTKETGAYVTIECLTGDNKAFARALKRGRITEDCPFDPEEEIIFNEGGTGAYRQALQVWESLGWVKLPEGPEGGAYGESRFDTPIGKWEFPEKGEWPQVRFDPQGTPVCSAPVRLSCPRGLRVSEYKNEYTQEGRTRYFG
jgi:hypothetical protein